MPFTLRNLTTDFISDVMFFCIQKISSVFFTYFGPFGLLRTFRLLARYLNVYLTRFATVQSAFAATFLLLVANIY